MLVKWTGLFCSPHYYRNNNHVSFVLVLWIHHLLGPDPYQDGRVDVHKTNFYVKTVLFLYAY